MSKKSNKILKTCDIFYPKKIYKVINIIKNKTYLFLGSYPEIDTIINKINKDGFKSLTADENKKLKTRYNATDLKQIDSDTILIKDFINDDDSIFTIKKKIMVHINPKSIPTKQHLWINKTKISSYDELKYGVNNYNELLGIEYNNTDKKLLLECDLFSDDILKIEIKNIEFDYTFNDKINCLLETYGNIINNTIMYIDYDEYIKKNESDLYQEKIDKITNIYFPLIKRTDVSFDKYDSLINDNMKINNEYENIFIGITDKSLFNGCKLRNVVMKCPQLNNLDLKLIFESLQTSSKTPFIKLKYNKEDFFKIYVTEFERKSVNNNFKSSDKYIEKFNTNKYKSEISKKQYLKWPQTDISNKEKYLLKMKKEESGESVSSNVNEILIKYEHDEMYYDINIFENNIIVRDLSSNVNAMDFYFNLISDINTFLKELNPSLLKNKITVIPAPWNFVTLDLTHNFVSKIKLSSINQNLGNFLNHVYKLNTASSNTLHLKYKKVDNFDSFENIQRFFINLKKTNPTMSVSEFSKTWKTECKHLFNLTELDADIYLTKLSETIADNPDILKKSILDIDIDIDIIITQNLSSVKDEFNYFIKVNNCNDIEHLKRIKKLLLIIFNSNKKITSLKKEIPDISKLIDIKKPQIDEDEELDLDDDFLDLDDDEDEDEDEDNASNTEKDITIAEDEYGDGDEEEDDEQISMDKNSVRNYMLNMRLLDKKLFNFTTSLKYKNYSTKCGAVDMRQPIILSKVELINFEKKNPEAFESLKKIEWGSSKSSKHFYICPRIWCIRDKIALTDDQLIKNDGRCPFCEGEIIDYQEKKIEDNKTVLIRKAGTNKYWADPDIASKKSDSWKKYLEETEKDAYPSFLDPGLNPSGYCMPCCNKNENWNYSKCLIVDVDYSIESSTVIKNLKVGTEMGTKKLKENDTILLPNVKKNNIIQIVGSGNEPVKYLGKLELELQTGMVIKIKNSGKSYNVTESKSGGFVFTEKIDAPQFIDERYVLGEDKFPLIDNKIGILNKKIDAILNKDSNKFLFKSRIIDDTQLFVRKGINQLQNLSFLECIGAIQDVPLSAYQILNKIIENLDPILFLGLNNGDLFKIFSSKNDTITNLNNKHLVFFKWCKTFYTTLNKLIELNNLNEDSSDLIVWLKIKLDSKETITKINDEFQVKLNDRTIEIEVFNFLVSLFFSFENYKKYCGDMNINKDLIYFVDILSQPINWLIPTGLNILVLENQMDRIFINCTLTEDITNILVNEKPLCVLIKNNNLFEPIVLSKTTKEIKPSFISLFDDDKNLVMNTLLLMRVMYIKNIALNQCQSKLDITDKQKMYSMISKNKLESIYTLLLGNNIKYILIDEFYKGIGVLTKDNLIIYTKSFGINVNFKRYDQTIEIRKLDSIPLKDYSYVIRNIDKLDYREPNISIILDSSEPPKVTGLLLEDGLIYPLKSEVYDKRIHKLNTTNINYVLNIAQTEIKDDKRVVYMNVKNIEDQYYNKTIVELNNFFISNNTNLNQLKFYINNIIDNPIIELTNKRRIIRSIIDQILRNIVVESTTVTIDSDKNKSAKRTKKIKKNKNCGDLKKAKCTKTVECKFEASDKNQIIELPDGTKLNFNFSGCKYNILKVYYESFLNKIIEQMLFSYKFKLDLFNNNLSSDLKQEEIINRGNYSKFINKLFNIKNFYIKNQITKTMKNTEINSDLIKIIDELEDFSTSEEPEVLTEVPYPYDPKELETVGDPKYAYKYNSKGVEIKDSNIQEGKCLFPFKRDSKDKLNVGVVQNEAGDYICATEKDDKNVMTKYGFYHESECQSDIIATTIDKDGKDRSLEKKDVKAGPCCFPFTFKNRSEAKEYSSCTNAGPSTKQHWCATSTTKRAIKKGDKFIAVNNYVKTYGYCPIQEAQEKLKDESKKDKKEKKKIFKIKVVAESKHPEQFTKSSKKCIFPFTYKDKKLNITNNKCAKDPNGEWCMIKENESGKAHYSPRSTYRKDWDYCKFNYENDKETTQWSAPLENKILFDKKIKPSIIKKDINTLDEAKIACIEDPNCKGITHNQLNNKFTLRSADKTIKGDSHVSFIKKK